MFEVDDRLGVGLAARLLEDVVLGDPWDPYRTATETAPDRSRPARWGEPFPPELGSDAPAVRTTTNGKPAEDGAASHTARRQQSRGNPNRGSRGNKRKR